MVFSLWSAVGFFWLAGDLLAGGTTVPHVVTPVLNGLIAYMLFRRGLRKPKRSSAAAVAVVLMFPFVLGAGSLPDPAPTDAIEVAAAVQIIPDNPCLDLGEHILREGLWAIWDLLRGRLDDMLEGCVPDVPFGGGGGGAW